MEGLFKTNLYTKNGVLYLITGILLCIFSPAGIMLLIFGALFLLSDKEVLSISEDYLTYKAAPLAGKKFILFDDIEEIIYAEKYFQLVLNTGKKIKISKRFFEDEQWDLIMTSVKSIKQLVPANNPVTKEEALI